ncbi:MULTISPECIES: TRAP transporter small permease [unclassified Oceanispirochaeta]|uniref:TRAP transporter small permease n=1 Tax=unclassified Oceanispirochaeta TaxID=2635722 RepID=UPI001313DFF2|nr:MULTISPECIES: TRAP transporter small permease [unclassified Oceanispirochaeta]MBF9018557.1 TRAP transporter small permease [Oceanispirochaeta sp. M2]NPD74965.1 TRAP transporter small permease [Oceanispirochaeta sp. M1]
MDNFFKKVDKILNASVVAILAVMLSLTVLQVILRYVFNNPTIWSEELTLFLLVWFGFIVMAMGVRADSHIALEYFYDRQGRRGQIILDAFRHSIIIALSLLMIFYGVQMIKLGWANKMPATQIRRGYLYASSLIGGILMATFSILNLLKLFLVNEEGKDAD